MNSNQHNIFSVPIWGYVLTNEKYHVYNYIKKIIELKENENSTIKSNQGGWQSHDRLHEVPVFRELINYLNILCNQSLQEWKKDSPKLEISEMWANVNNTKSYNHHHIHSGVVSGVFYLQIPKNSGKLILINPAVRADGHFIRTDNYGVEPINLACILFPSWLEHYVEPNLSNDDRISISFNSRFV